MTDQPPWAAALVACLRALWRCMGCFHWAWSNPWWAMVMVAIGLPIATGLSFLKHAYEHQPPPPVAVMLGSPEVHSFPGVGSSIVTHYEHHYPGPCVREGVYSLSQTPIPPDNEIRYYPLGAVLNGYGQRTLGAFFSVEFFVAPDVHGPQTFWFRTSYWCPIMFPLGMHIFDPPFLVRHFDDVTSVSVTLP